MLSRKNPVPIWHGRGGGSQVTLRNAFWNMVCERPPVCAFQRWLRSIFLMAQPSLLFKAEVSKFATIIGNARSRGLYARGYESAVDSSKNSNRLPAADDGAVRHFPCPNLDTSALVKEGSFL